MDPLVLQPASLDVATIKKKPEEDLGSLSAHSLSNGTDGIDLWIQVKYAIALFYVYYVMYYIILNSFPNREC